MTQAERMVDRCLEGETESDILEDVLQEKTVSAMQARKMLRRHTPRLYAHVSKLDLLHDFAADLLSMKKDKIIKKYELPKDLLSDLDNAISGL